MSLFSQDCNCKVFFCQIGKWSKWEKSDFPIPAFGEHQKTGLGKKSEPEKKCKKESWRILSVVGVTLKKYDILKKLENVEC